MVNVSSKDHSELRAEPGAGRDAARRELGGDAAGAGLLGAPQPPHAHHAAALLRRRLHALQSHLLLRWRIRPVSQPSCFFFSLKNLGTIPVSSWVNN